ncbi:MAG: RNA 2',3'-cyclic phosphodiesterase [Gemmatimonadaceae bacterium]
MPQEVRRGLRDTAASLVGSAPGVSVAAEHALHLTLAFLGEWPEPMAGDFAQALRAACAERYPFWMRLEGIGAFPNPRAPRIVWIGVHAGAELASLHAEVESACAAVGYKPERRTFRPHVTLARLKAERAASVAAALTDGVQSVPFAADVNVRSVGLMRSELAGTGARHTLVYAARFGGE